MTTTNRSASALRSFVTVITLAGASLLVACEGNGQRRLDRSIAAYEEGSYAQSLELAEGAVKEARTAKEADEALYLAGMSAYRLGRYVDAERFLAQSARSGDPWIAGQSGVTLGSTQLSLGRRAEAGRTFARAAEKLEGDEARRARIAAGNAFRDLGDLSMAEEQFRLAGAGGSGAVAQPSPVGAMPSRTLASAATGNDFTLQAGAFRDQNKALRRADELRRRAVQIGFGEPRISSKRGADGTTLFVVQIGSFRDRSAATSALGRLGAEGVVVARVAAS